jgi:hypothetical protein
MRSRRGQLLDSDGLSFQWSRPVESTIVPRDVLMDVLRALEQQHWLLHVQLGGRG